MQNNHSTIFFRWGDLFVFAFIFWMAVWSYDKLDFSPGKWAVVTVNNQPVARWNIEGAVHIDSIHHDIGTTYFELGNGKIRIIRAPCAHQVCRKMGSIHASYERIVCIPARLSVKLTGNSPKNSDVDVISY